MNIGDMDRRVVIERATYATNEYGEEIETWGQHAEVWAKFTPISDGERLRAQEVAAHITSRFVIRWGFGVTPRDRLIHDGRTYDIFGVKEVGRREGQEITASARAE